MFSASVKIWNKYIYITHRVNLAVVDSIKEIKVLKQFKDKISGIYRYLSDSANRTYSLKAMQRLLEEPVLKVTEP